MKLRNWGLLISIIIAAGCTVYSLLPVLLVVHSGIYNGGQLGKAVAQYPDTGITVLVAFATWIVVSYQFTKTEHKEILRMLLRDISGTRDNWVIYNVFKGSGWRTRAQIVESLKTPKLRNEIAKLVGKDWREVDRNIHILESAGIVKIQSVHDSIILYELTERGTNLQKVLESRGSRPLLTVEDGGGAK